MRSIRLLCLILLAATAIGCGRVHELHSLRGTYEMNHIDGVPLEYAYINNPALSQAVGKSVGVQLAKLPDSIGGNSKITKKMDWAKWQPDFERVVANQLWRTGLFRDVGATSDTAPIVNPDLLFKVAVTEWHEGYWFLRWIIGFGLGATRMQWEGQLIDRASGQVLFSFADARLHPGGPTVLGIGNRRVFYGSALIAQDLGWASDDLRRALRAATATDRPERPATEPRPLYRSSDTQALSSPTFVPAPVAIPPTAQPRPALAPANTAPDARPAPARTPATRPAPRRVQTPPPAR